MTTFKLPSFSTLLSGHSPPDDAGLRSDELQMYNPLEPWQDEGLHARRASDECVIARDKVTVGVEATPYVISAGELCWFPVGVFHAIVEVETPAETLMIRAPSVPDEVYRSG